MSKNVRCERGEAFKLDSDSDSDDGKAKLSLFSMKNSTKK